MTKLEFIIWFLAIGLLITSFYKNLKEDITKINQNLFEIKQQNTILTTFILSSKEELKQQKSNYTNELIITPL